MGFAALRFDAAAPAAEAWSDALLEAGALSADLADPDLGTAREQAIYGEPGVDVPGAWPMTRVTALFADPGSVATAIAASATKLGAPFPAHAVFDVPDQDWVRATQAQFTPIHVEGTLWIVPSWAEPVDPHAINLVLDPGLAFGTGSHSTTRLCLRWLLAARLAGRTVLDYGCGSGILAIAAARLGAAALTGIDIDPQAVLTSRANAARNGVRDATFATPDALPEGATFDVVVANILANPLVLLAPALARRVRPGGALLLSGVLAGQATDVVAAYTPWFRMTAWNEEDGWVALAGDRLG
ncbi:MAG: 50S ribosomal protein L11 methyltransferase [Casimicrobiaceae bacterium]